MKKYFAEIEKMINNKLESENINNYELIDLYLQIGKIISLNKLNYKEIVMLERYLQSKYGIVIGFTRRNLINIKNFYNTYNNCQIKSLLKKVNWYKHLWIMRNGKDQKERLIEICSKYNLQTSDLRNILKNKDLKEYKNLEINDNNNDEMVKELISLQNRMQKM